MRLISCCNKPRHMEIAPLKRAPEMQLPERYTHSFLVEVTLLNPIQVHLWILQICQSLGSKLLWTILLHYYPGCALVDQAYSRFHLKCYQTLYFVLELNEVSLLQTHDRLVGVCSVCDVCVGGGGRDVDVYVCIYNEMKFIFTQNLANLRYEQNILY